MKINGKSSKREEDWKKNLRRERICLFVLVQLLSVHNRCDSDMNNKFYFLWILPVQDINISSVYLH